MSMFYSPFLIPTINLQTALLISNVIDFEADRTGDFSLAFKATAVLALLFDTECPPLDFAEKTLLDEVFVLANPIWLGVWWW